MKHIAPASAMIGLSRIQLDLDHLEIVAVNLKSIACERVGTRSLHSGAAGARRPEVRRTTAEAAAPQASIGSVRQSRAEYPAG